MWFLVLLACASAPPPPSHAHPLLGPPWDALALDLPADAFVVERADSLQVRCPADAVSLSVWTEALEAQGWVPEVTSSDGRLHATRWSRDDTSEEPSEALVLGATRYEGAVTFSLVRVPTP